MSEHSQVTIQEFPGRQRAVWMLKLTVSTDKDPGRGSTVFFVEAEVSEFLKHVFIYTTRNTRIIAWDWMEKGAATALCTLPYTVNLIRTRVETYPSLPAGFFRGHSKPQKCCCRPHRTCSVLFPLLTTQELLLLIIKQLINIYHGKASSRLGHVPQTTGSCIGSSLWKV